MTGNPFPSMAWFHEGRRLAVSEDFQQLHDVDGERAMLFIKEVYPEDTGRYTAVARNSQGAATSSADLHVQIGEKL